MPFLKTFNKRWITLNPAFYFSQNIFSETYVINLLDHIHSDILLALRKIHRGLNGNSCVTNLRVLLTFVSKDMGEKISAHRAPSYKHLRILGVFAGNVPNSFLSILILNKVVSFGSD